MKICIDAGHNFSGYDTGATGNGLKEQNITFPIANKLKALLEGIGIAVVMTRPTLESNTDNSSLNASINKRAQICNSNNCNLFVSIHANAGGGTGTETYAFSEKSEGYTLATAINKAIVEKLKLRDRGAKTANFGVLRLSNCPAVLVETAFIDNYSDSLLLKNNQDDFATAIFNGICTHLGYENKPVQEQAAEVKELETINDLVWELSERGILSNKELWLKKLGQDSDAYWLARKTVKYLMSKGV